MSVSQPNYSNVFVPGFSGETTAKLIVDFSRNPKDFPINQIAGTITVKEPSGYYLHLKPEAQGRIINSPQSYEWADGAPCPIQVENGQDFEYTKYFTKRVVRSFPLGYMTAEFAAWDIEAAQARVLANQIMTIRAVSAYTVLQASGSYLTANIDTATNWGGGLWGSATSTNRYIQKTINKMRQAVAKATFDTVKATDFILVMSPVVADAVSRTAEVADYMANSVTAKDFLTYEVWQSQTQNYGLPPTLYGVKLMVDSSVKSTNLLGGTDAKAFLPGDNSVYMVAKPGSLSTPAGGESFGALTFFINKNWEMRTETIDQPIDARKILRVTDMFDCQMVAKEAAACATAVLS